MLGINVYVQNIISEHNLTIEDHIIRSNKKKNKTSGCSFEILYFSYHITNRLMFLIIEIYTNQQTLMVLLRYLIHHLEVETNQLRETR